jgi:hypothetical protein
MTSALHVKWVKLLARKLRWTEEVSILQEEMHHIIAYCAWHRTWWKNCIDVHVGLSLGLQEGLQAYAICQSTIHSCCTVHLERKWNLHGTQAQNSLTPSPDWVSLGAAAKISDEE